MLADIGKLLIEMSGSINRAEIGYLRDDAQFPDRELIFSSYLSLEEIKNHIREVEDGHVMLQTVQPIEKYIGERDYNIE